MINVSAYSIAMAIRAMQCLLSALLFNLSWSKGKSVPHLTIASPINLLFMTEINIKVTLSQSVSHFNLHDLLCDYQPAYRSRYSTKVPFRVTTRKLPFDVTTQKLPFHVTARKLPFHVTARKLPFHVKAWKLIFHVTAHKCLAKSCL